MYNNPVWFSDPFGDCPGCGDAKDFDPNTTYPDDQDPLVAWKVLYKADGEAVWSKTFTVIKTATRITREQRLEMERLARLAEAERVAAYWAGVEARRAENLSRTRGDYHRTVADWTNRQIEGMQSRDVDNATLFTRGRWLVEDLGLALVSLSGSSDELSGVLANSTDLDKIPLVSTAVAAAHIHQEGWSWGNALNLGLSLTDWIPGGGYADNAAVGIFFWMRRSDDALESGGKQLLKEGAEEAGEKTLTKSRRAAFREAKEKGGIPKSQQPIEVANVPLRDQEGYVLSRVYSFKRVSDGANVEILEHSLGHTKGNLGPHFNTIVREKNTLAKQQLNKAQDHHTFFSVNK